MGRLLEQEKIIIDVISRLERSRTEKTAKIRFSRKKLYKFRKDNESEIATEKRKISEDRHVANEPERARIRETLEWQEWKKTFKEKHGIIPRPDLDLSKFNVADDNVFKISDFPANTLMAHIMKEVGLFNSVSQARKNGWDKPIEVGEWVVGKKKVKVKICQ